MKGSDKIMARIIFSDFDCTLLDLHSEKNYFDEYQLGILEKLKQQGNKFCILTGRCVSFFEDFPELLRYVDYIVGSNGAVIYDVVNKKFIYQKLIEKETFDRVIDYCLNNSYSFLLNCLDKKYQYGCWKSIVYNFFDRSIDYCCEQIILSFERNEMEKISNFIEGLPDLVVNNFTSRGEKCCFDININGVTKGKAVIWLCSYLGIGVEESICFGDGDNDISAFEVAGKGIAVANASDKIRQICDDVTLNCENSGVFKYIEDSILR